MMEKTLKGEMKVGEIPAKLKEAGMKIENVSGVTGLIDGKTIFFGELIITPDGQVFVKDTKTNKVYGPEALLSM